MNRPQNSFWTLPWLPKIANLGPKKGKNNPDLGQKQKLKLKEGKKIKKLELNKKPQNSFENQHNQKNKPFESQKSKTTPKSRQNQMSELKENKKTKFVVLYE